MLGRPLRRRFPQRPSCTSGLALSREHHSCRWHTSHVSTAARSCRLPHQSPSPILKRSSSNSNLIGLTLLLLKAVIGPSLSKMSLRIGAAPAVFVPVSVVLGFPLLSDHPPSRGASDPSTGGHFHTPRSPNRSSAPVLSPGRHRVALWDGRGATSRPREVKWSSRLAAVFWECYNHSIFKDPNDYYDVKSVLYNKDYGR